MHAIHTLEEIKSLIEGENSGEYCLDLSNKQIECEINFSTLFNTNNGHLIKFTANKTRFKKPVIIDIESYARFRPLSIKQSIFEEGIEIINCNFQNPADFSGTIFEQKFQILGTSFHNKINMSESIIKGPVEFTNSNFNGALFRKSVFNEKTDFSESTFTNADFSDCIFNRATHFINTTFNGDSHFMRTVFNKETGFLSAKFETLVCFLGAQFNTDASFSGTSFDNGANFDLADFSGNIRFDRTLFWEQVTFNELSSIKEASICFFHIKLNGSSKLYFEFSEFESRPKDFRGKITFEGLRVEDGDTYIYIANLSKENPCQFSFNNCQFHAGNVELTNSRIAQVNVNSAYGWRGFSFTTSCQWPSFGMPFSFLFTPAFRSLPDEGQPKRHNPYARASEYALLKSNAKAQGDNQLASDFYAWQMWWSLKDNPKQLWKWVYYLTSVFGLSVSIPLFWLGVVILVAFTIYSAMIYDGWYGFSSSKNVQLWLLTFSGMNPFYYQLDLTKFFQESSDWRIINITLVFIIQRILALYLYFQAGAAIRSRVKQ